LTIRNDIRQMGFAGWLLYATNRALNRISKGRVEILALRFYLQPLPADRLVEVRENDPVRVGPVSPASLDLAAFGRPIDAIHERIAAGSICIAALRERELLGFMWLQRGALKERLVECYMRVEPSSQVVWDYDFFIHPRYRLGRLFGRLWDAAASTLREEGVAATISWIRIENRASELAHARLGAQRIGWAVFVRLRGGRAMVTSFPPYLSYSKKGDALKLQIDLRKRSHFGSS
jgi:hypothetical protein